MPMTWTIQDRLVIINLIGTQELDEFRETTHPLTGQTVRRDRAKIY
jgi:hypothetical protein